MGKINPEKVWASNLPKDHSVYCVENPSDKIKEDTVKEYNSRVSESSKSIIFYKEGAIPTDANLTEIKSICTFFDKNNNPYFIRFSYETREKDSPNKSYFKRSILENEKCKPNQLCKDYNWLHEQDKFSSIARQTFMGSIGERALESVGQVTIGALNYILGDNLISKWFL